MRAPVTLTVDEVSFVHSERVARLATVDGAGSPHVVPVCYAFDGARFYTPLDEKPKRVADGELRRVRNILASGRVALVIDRYDDVWSRLAYLLVRGTAELLPPRVEGHAAALTLLRERYPQYRAMSLEDRAVIAIAPRHVVSWGAIGLHQNREPAAHTDQGDSTQLP